MRLTIALFAVVALLAGTAAGLKLASRHDGDGSLRVIHYQTHHELSAQRRMPAR